jgi:hypothetical protein
MTLPARAPSGNERNLSANIHCREDLKKVGFLQKLTMVKIQETVHERIASVRQKKNLPQKRSAERFWGRFNMMEKMEP